MGGSGSGGTQYSREGVDQPGADALAAFAQTASGSKYGDQIQGIQKGEKIFASSSGGYAISPNDMASMMSDRTNGSRDATNFMNDFTAWNQGQQVNQSTWAAYAAMVAQQGGDKTNLGGGGVAPGNPAMPANLGANAKKGMGV